MKCARSFIPHSYSGMDRTPFHPFCSQEQNERNVANENQRWRTAGRVLSIQTRPYRTYRRKNVFFFGQNEALSLISLYQKYEAYFSDVSYKKKAIWQMIADDMRKSGYSLSATNCENRWKCLTSSFRKCEDKNNKSGRRNVYSCQDRASRRAFFYAGNPNYSEHSVPTILIPE